MRKIEHIGIAVKSLEEAQHTYSQIFGKPAYKTESVESEGVNTAFLNQDPTKSSYWKPPNPKARLQSLLKNAAKASTTLRLMWPT